MKTIAGRLLVAVVALAGFYWLTDGVDNPLYAHLDAIKAGDLSGAYEQTAPQFREDMSFDQYEAFIKRYPSLAQMNTYEIGGSSVTNGSATVYVTATGAGGTVLPLTYTLVEDSDAWRIVSVGITDPSDVDDE